MSQPDRIDPAAAHGNRLPSRRRLVFRVLAFFVTLEAGLQAAVLVRDLFAPRPAPTGDAALTVLCAGDSNTFGVGAPAGSSYPDQLQKLLRERTSQPWSVVNLGRPGLNSTGARREVERYLARGSAAAVLFLGGVNNRWNAGGLEVVAGETDAPLAPLARVDRALTVLKTYSLARYLALRSSGSTTDAPGNEPVAVRVPESAQRRRPPLTSAIQEDFKDRLAREEFETLLAKRGPREALRFVGEQRAARGERDELFLMEVRALVRLGQPDEAERRVRSAALHGVDPRTRDLAAAMILAMLGSPSAPAALRRIADETTDGRALVLLASFAAERGDHATWDRCEAEALRRDDPGSRVRMLYLAAVWGDGPRLSRLLERNDLQLLRGPDLATSWIARTPEARAARERVFGLEDGWEPFTLAVTNALADGRAGAEYPGVAPEATSEVFDLLVRQQYRDATARLAAFAETASAAGSPSADLFLMLAYLARMNGDSPAALAALDRAEAAAGAWSPPVSRVRARAIFAAGRPAEAYAEFRRSRGDQPFPEFRPDDFGECALAAGRIDEARAAFRRYLDRVAPLDLDVVAARHPSWWHVARDVAARDGGVAHMMAETCLRLGDREEALLWLRREFRASDDFPRFQSGLASVASAGPDGTAGLREMLRQQLDVLRAEAPDDWYARSVAPWLEVAQRADPTATALSSDLLRLSRACETAGARLFVLTYPSDAINPDIRALAARHGAALVEIADLFANLSFDDRSRLLCWDGHPTAEGYALIARRACDRLVEAGVARPRTDPPSKNP